jgi:hypothetical protein
MSIFGLCLPILIGASRGRRVYRARGRRGWVGGRRKVSSMMGWHCKGKRSGAACMGVTLATWSMMIVSSAMKCVTRDEERAKP